MKSFNFKNVLLSGLAAGLIIIVSAVTMVPVMGNQMDEVLASRGLPPLSTAAMVFFSFVSVSFGIVLMFLYSILKPYIVSKLKTLLIASFLLWFVGYFLSNASLVAYGFMPVKIVVIGTIWGLGELLLAGFVGARFCKAD